MVYIIKQPILLNNKYNIHRKRFEDLVMAKKTKKTLISFLLLISALWGAYTVAVNASTEFQIPLPVVIIVILVIYLLWKDDNSP